MRTSTKLTPLPPTTLNVMEALHAINIFHNLEDADLAPIAALCDIHTYKRRTNIVMSDAMSSRVLLVVEGAFRVVAGAPNGRTVSMCTYQSGNVYGFRAAMAPQKQSDYAQRFHFEENTTILSVHRAAFREFVAKHACVCLAVLEAQCVESTELDTRFFEAMTLDMRGRLIAELARMMVDNPDGAFPVAPTNGELGDRIRATREAVNRGLKNLEREGVVRVERRRLTIADSDKLKALNENSVGRVRTKTEDQFT